MIGSPREPRDLLTVQQALALLPVGRTTIYALCESGALPHFRILAPGSRRGRILIARRDIEAFLERSRHEPRQAPVSPDIDAIHNRVRRQLAAPGGNRRSPSGT